MADTMPDPKDEKGERTLGENPLPNDTPAEYFRQAEERTLTYASSFQLMAAGGLSTPKRLGKYEIQEPVGRGGMGVVWKAFDPDLHRTVAIKVLGEHLVHSPTARRRFLREARAVAAISHPHVLTIHSVDEQDSIPFLVMEYVSGASLKEYVATNGPLDPLEVLRLGGQIAQGLAAAHAQGVTHRDVKPGNVMLDQGATCAQLTDFGLARVAFDNVELTSHDQKVGTPSYMSPESLRGDSTDARSDLFSLGCVLYFMLTGYAPFQGRSPAEMIHKILDSEPLQLHEMNRAIPIVLSDIVHELLRKNPEQRIQSAAEVAEVLTRLLHQVNQAPTDEIPTVLANARSSSSPPSTRSRKAWILPIGACVLAGAVFLTPSWFAPQPVDVPEMDAAVQAGADGATDAPKVVERFDHLIVGPGPEAHYATIAEAIEHARPGATINVVGPGPFADAVDIAGSDLDGLQLTADPRAVWTGPLGTNHRFLRIGDVSDVLVRGFDFDVNLEAGRAVQIEGDARGVTIEDCTFRHSLPEHRLSLVQLATVPQDETSVVTIRNCNFEAAEGPVTCLALGANGSATRVVCSGCLFRGPNVLVYVDDACRQVSLSHNVFLHGSVGINCNYKRWSDDSRLEVVNSTFVDVRYWFGLMKSFRSGSLPYGNGTSRVCNNLILGGHRVQGGDDQWAHVLSAWEFSSNWWERDPSTHADAGRGGRIAELRGRLDILERRDIDAPDFLRPEDDSPLLTSGVGGDLPTYIGAKGPK